LQQLIETKWVLNPDDKDMIVMQHQFEYILEGQNKRKVVSMVQKGDNAKKTSMSKTVGLPLGIAVDLILSGKVALSGVHIPVVKEVYVPVLEILETLGIRFVEDE